MKKINFKNRKRQRGFISSRLINTMIVLALIMLLAGPILLIGSVIMKVLMVVVLVGIVPNLFARNYSNKSSLWIFTLVLLALIFFRWSHIIPVIVIVLLATKLLNKGISNSEGTYRYTNRNNYSSFNASNFKDSNYGQGRSFTNNNTEPKDPFSYRKRESEIIDVEYEDWEPETKKQSYTEAKVNRKKSMDYSYSGNMSETGQGIDESEDDCCDRNTSDEREVEHNKQKVYIGSISKTIHQDSLNVGDNELSFICKLGDLDLIIDSRVETDIFCSIKAGEIKIGNESYNGVNQKIKRSWSPTTASNKRLKLNCEVGLGEIKIRHKKLY